MGQAGAGHRRIYTLMPGEKAFATPDTSWTNHSVAHLRQNDFRTIASAADHPDFSRSGGRMEFGFMRVQIGSGQSKGGARQLPDDALQRMTRRS